MRLPPILIAALALVILWWFVRRELGTAWAALLLALLATDPVLLNHARLDWGPQMIAAFLRVLSLVALWRWLQTGRKRWLIILCASFLVGFIDKLNFIWVIGAWIAAAAVVTGRLALGRLRDGRPWQPLIVAISAALLLWGMVTLVRRAAQLDVLGDAESLSLSAQLLKVWNLYAATFSGMSVINWVFGADVPVTSAFNILLIVQLVTAVALLAVWRPWSPARRLLAFLTAATAFLVIAIAATRQVGGSHHLLTIWPMPALHLVTLLAISTQHLGTERGRGMMLRATVATTGAIVWGALLAWHIAMDLRYVDTWRNDRDYRPLFDPAIARLGKRLDELAVDRVISVDWGLHQPLVTLADRRRAADYREWTWRLIDSASDLEREDLRRAVDQTLARKRVAFVLHAPGTPCSKARASASMRCWRETSPAARARSASPTRPAGRCSRSCVADYQELLANAAHGEVDEDCRDDGERHIADPGPAARGASGLDAHHLARFLDDHRRREARREGAEEIVGDLGRRTVDQAGADLCDLAPDVGLHGVDERRLVIPRRRQRHLRLAVGEARGTALPFELERIAGRRRAVGHAHRAGEARRHGTHARGHHRAPLVVAGALERLAAGQAGLEDVGVVQRRPHFLGRGGDDPRVGHLHRPHPIKGRESPSDSMQDDHRDAGERQCGADHGARVDPFVVLEQEVARRKHETAACTA